MPFSRQFIRSLKSKRIIISRRDLFGRSAICINHGNHNPLSVKKQVIEFILINQPDHIRYCSNKRRNIEILEEFYPETYNSIDEVNKYPVIVKPLHGRHGIGVKKMDTKRDLQEFASTNSIRNFLIQEYIPLKNEYRFNVLDGEIYQISKKELLEGYNDKGFDFEWKSLGKEAKIHPKHFTFVNDVIDKFHKTVGNRLGSYCVDVMKSANKRGYFLAELNSGYGIGSFTIEKLVEILNRKYRNGDLSKYRVK